MAAFLGLDYGKRRVGVAVGDDQRGIAFAHGTHREGHDGSVVDYLAAIISERDITTLVVGLPLRADGSEGEITTATRKFAALLEERLGLPVVLWDERFSSTEADRWLMDRRKKAKEDRDALAAEIILQSYLDSLRAQGDAP